MHSNHVVIKAHSYLSAHFSTHFKVITLKPFLLLNLNFSISVFFGFLLEYFQFILIDLIDYGDGKGFTALMHAAFAKNIDCMQLLLKSGSKPEVVDGKGRTALHFCARQVLSYSVSYCFV